MARRLGKPADSIGRQLRWMRQAGGWYCVLRLPFCTVCGQTVVGPPKRITHLACVPARQARWARDKRDRVKVESTPEALAEQRARERAAALRTYRALPPEQRAAWFARAKATQRRDYAITREVADARRQPWTDDAEHYVLDTLDQPAREVGLTLGGTSRAGGKRRAVLRERLAKPQAELSRAIRSGPSRRTDETSGATG